MGRRKVLVGLIIAATALFAVAFVVERSHAEVHGTNEDTSHSESGAESTHEETGGSLEGDTGANTSSASDEGTILGVNPESTALATVAAAGSLLLAAGLWFRPAWRWPLMITALGMSLFTVLDVREVLHQLDESRTSLALLATLVAALHLSAAAVAATLLARRGDVESISA
jgi:hypothetical protein